MALRRYSTVRGRRLRFDEALGEKFLMSWLGNLFTLHVAPRIDKVIIPRTGGRLSSLGIDKVGLVTTTGARTGLERTQPLVLIDDGEGLLAVGSNYGRPQHPAWSHNLIAHPSCSVEFRAPPTPYRARLLEGTEREKAWATVTDFGIAYEQYQRRCVPRTIRVFRLTPE